MSEGAPQASLDGDLRNIYRPSTMAAEGFDYISVGRGGNKPEFVIYQALTRLHSLRDKTWGVALDLIL